MRSLRSQLLIGASLVAMVVLTASSLLAFTLMRSALHREFDTALIAQVRALTALAVRDGKRLRLEYEAYLLPEYAREERPDVFCFWDRHGEVLMRSPGLTAGDLPFASGTLAEPALRDAVLPDGRPGRVAGLSFIPRQLDVEHGSPATGTALTVAAARDSVDRDHQLTVLGVILVAAATSGSLASILLMWWLSGRLLRPLDLLARRIAAITPERLSVRLGDLAMPGELVPIRRCLDELLSRLESAFQRERAFTADAAHELRTPLSGLRTTLEVALSRARPAEDYRQALDESLAISGQLQSLVDNLLALARVEAGLVRIERAPTDVRDLIEACWKVVATRAHARALRCVVAVTGPTTVPLDRAKVHLVLSNLFDNAVTYADEGGDIAITGVIDQARLAVTIANSGCLLPASAAGRVFERFWRGDAAHGAVGLHCGLGLALCQTLVQALGGTITATISDGRFRVTIDLPLSG